MAATTNPTATVLAADGKEKGTVELAASLFAAPISEAMIHQAVVRQMAGRRLGTADTLTRGEVHGGGKKPWRQKGTGRARQGSLRSPQFRGGAVIFGPVVRDHGYDLPKKVRTLGLKTALSSKQADGKLIVIDEAKLPAAKTKELASRLGKLGLKSVLFIGGAEIDQGFARAVRNLPLVDVLPQQGANVYDILRRDTLVLTRDAVQALEARLK